MNAYFKKRIEHQVLKITVGREVPFVKAGNMK
jgi:hypothetical protein